MFKYGRKKASRKNRRLEGTLTVVPSEDVKIESRIRYNALFWLKGEQVGQIDAWRVDKQTVNAPNAKATWIDDYLTPEYETLQGVTADTSLLLRALFRRDGKVKKSVRVLRQELDDGGFMIIALVHTEAAYQKR